MRVLALTIILSALVPESRDEHSVKSRLTSWRQPFSNSVWFLLLGVMFVSGVVYGFLMHEEGEPNAAGAFQGVFQSVGTMTGAGNFAPRSAKGKTFVLFFSFFTLLVVSAYTANLTTFLTVEAVGTQPIERISSFSELGLSPCYYGGSTEWFLEQEHPNIRGVSLRDLDLYDPGAERYAQLFEALRQGECSGIVTWTHYARNVIVNDRLKGGAPTGCDVEIVGPEEGNARVRRVLSTRRFRACSFMDSPARRSTTPSPGASTTTTRSTRRAPTSSRR